MTQEEKVNKIVNKIVSDFKPVKVILFGSHAWGTPGPDSDLDFFVIQRTSENRLEREVKLRKAIFPAGVPVDVISYTPEEVQKRIDRRDFFIERILSEGKVLYAE